jgi:hypothetical protein
LSVVPMKGPWSADTQSGAADRLGGLAFSAKDRQSSISLALTLADGPADGATIIDRAWIQTWLTEKVRQDRAVFRFRSTDAEVRLALPDGASADEIEAWLDGQPTSPQVSKQRELSIALDAAAGPNHVLELRYQFVDRPSPGNLQFTAPQWKPGLWVRRVYWQLILPGSEHLLLTPNDLTPEFAWNWNGLFWQRDPSLEQADLEHWIGARVTAAEPGRSNRYLFSTAGSNVSLDVTTARRSVIVFVASLLVLAVGLILIYVPASRHPLPVVVAAVVLLGAGIVEPETTLLFAQAAGLGLALVVCAFLLARKSFRKTAHRSAPSGMASVIKDRSATELYTRPVKAGPPPSTATAPMAMQASGPEVNG